MKRNKEQVIINAYQLVIIKYNEDLKEWEVTRKENIGSYKTKQEALNIAKLIKSGLYKG
jgi:hypothetical protein